MVLAPLAAIFVFMRSVWNGRPTMGTAFVEIPSVLVGRSTDLGTLGDANVTSAPRVVLEVGDARIVDAHYLPADLAHGAVVLGLLVAALAAVLVLRRRPASRLLVGALVVYAALAAAAAWAGPAARQRAVDRTIDLYGVPTGVAQARESGVGYYAVPDVVTWSDDWHGAFVALALASLGAATYVLHVRSSHDSE